MKLLTAGLIVLLLLTVVAFGLTAEPPPQVAQANMYLTIQSAVNVGVPDVAIQYQDRSLQLLLYYESADSQPVLAFTSETERRVIERSARDWVNAPATQTSYI